MQTFNLKRGSTFIEAAIIFPIIVLVAAALIKTGITYYDRVYKQSQIEMKYEYPEAIARGRWMIF